MEQSDYFMVEDPMLWATIEVVCSSYMGLAMVVHHSFAEVVEVVSATQTRISFVALGS